LRIACGPLEDFDAVGKAGAGFKSLGNAWADTTTPHGRLMLTVLGGNRHHPRRASCQRSPASAWIVRKWQCGEVEVTLRKYATKMPMDLTFNGYPYGPTN
jgi:hypothetical protein